MTKTFNIDTHTGLLSAAIFMHSPHQDERPQASSIDMIVIHGISLPPGEFGGHAIEAFFCGHLPVGEHPYFTSIANLKVSAHLLIKRNGDIIQFVPFHKRAWHAGESQFRGQTRCNDFSIGIELEGTDNEVYEKIQYAQLSSIIRALQQAYLIPHDRIVGHADIAPGRKTDPGPFFDWNYLKGTLA